MIEFLKVQHIGPSAITWIKYEDNDEEILVFDDITIFHMKLNPPRRESKIFIKDDWIEYDCGNPKLARDMSIQSMKGNGERREVHKEWSPFARFQGDEWGWKGALHLAEYLDNTLMQRIKT
jgi:hypothetical protein